MVNSDPKRTPTFTMFGNPDVSAATHLMFGNPMFPRNVLDHREGWLLE